MNKVEKFDIAKYEYYSIHKNKFILKNSDNQFIGREMDQTEWQVLIHLAFQEPEKWEVEEIIEE